MSEQTTAVTKPMQTLPVSPDGVDALAIERRPATAATADEARTVAVSEMLTLAYQQASQLKLTEAESKALRAPFGDDAVRGGAKGDERILYISHIHLSDRLNDVLGIGQWAIVKRSQRAEQTKTVDGKPLTRIYFEGVMVVRGAFVAEAIGVGQYHPNNPKEDYGSALESAMSDSLTRCCKRLGIGSQVWDKGYCENWLANNRGPRPVIRPPQSKSAPTPPAETEQPAAKPVDRDALVAEIGALMDKIPASKIDKAMKAIGCKWQDGEAWEQLPDDRLTALKSLLSAAK